MKGYIRTNRLANEIRRNVALILQHKIRDPRLGNMVTVLGIDIAKDLSHARIFVTFLDTNVDQLDKKLKILCSASGFIRSSLAKSMFLRIVPELFFVYDTSSTKGMRVYRLLNQRVLYSSHY